MKNNDVWEGSEDYPFKSEVKVPIVSSIEGVRAEELDKNNGIEISYIKLKDDE